MCLIFDQSINRFAYKKSENSEKGPSGRLVMSWVKNPKYFKDTSDKEKHQVLRFKKLQQANVKRH